MNPHNLAATRVRKTHGRRVVEINTRKAHYYGIPWHSLGRYGKRKLENIVFLQNADTLTKIIYI